MIVPPTVRFDVNKIESVASRQMYKESAFLSFALSLKPASDPTHGRCAALDEAGRGRLCISA